MWVSMDTDQVAAWCSLALHQRSSYICLDDGFEVHKNTPANLIHSSQRPPPPPHTLLHWSLENVPPPKWNVVQREGVEFTCPHDPVTHSVQASDTHSSLSSGRGAPSHSTLGKTRMPPPASRRWQETCRCRTLRPHDDEHLDQTVETQLEEIHILELTHWISASGRFPLCVKAGKTQTFNTYD